MTSSSKKGKKGEQKEMKILDDMKNMNLQHKIFSKSMLYTMQRRRYSISIPLLNRVKVVEG
jgi:hypothetical protein